MKGATAAAPRPPADVIILPSPHLNSTALTAIAVLRSASGGVGTRICVLSPEPARLGALLADLHGHVSSSTLEIVRCDGNQAALLKAESARRAGADLVYVEAGCVVAPGWIEGLQEAAYADTITATASALTTRESLLGLAQLNPDLDVNFEDMPAAAGSVRTRSRRVHPMIPPGLTHTIYVKRMAYELVGGLSGDADSAHAALHQLTSRAVASGLVNVLADEVLVSPGAATAERRSRGSVAEPDQPRRETVLQRAVRHASGPPRPMRVLLDGTRLDAPVTGTQVHILELVAALSQRTDVDVGLMVPEQLHPAAQGFLEEATSVRLLSQTAAPSFNADVFHRTFQMAFPAEMSAALQLGARFVLTHQDLIGYAISDYYPSAEDWRSYRALTAAALSRADAVLTFSWHTARSIAREGLASEDRMWVVPLGVDHRRVRRSGLVEAAPVPAPRTNDELILCLGNDFRHKNRLFALRVCSELRQSHGWRGTLVLAGPHVTHGSSWDEESQWVADHLDGGAWVLRLGEISEAEKRWLFMRARVALYPTVLEGFGLIPFESATFSVPCAFAPTSSLEEMFADEAFAIVPWNAAASAIEVERLLRDGGRRDATLAAVRETAVSLTWNATAERAVAVYEEVLGRPAQSGSGGLEDERTMTLSRTPSR